MVSWLSSDSGFPPIEEASSEGIVAIGGSLSSERLISAYRRGIFPWYGPGQPVLWWSPDPRAIIPLETFRPGRTLKKILRQGTFDVRVNTAFDEVIRMCAVREDGNPSGWITEEMIEGYTELHRLGLAHSVETWQRRRLVGGLYGVAVGGLFAGESMFFRVANASKAALAVLVDRLRARGFTLLDCQMITPVTAAMGAREIPRRRYLELLAEALRKPCSFVD